MNIPRLILSIVVLFVVSCLYNFVAHGVILGKSYAATEEVWKPMDEMMARMWLQYLCFFVFMIGFVILWALAFPGKGTKCGATYGAVVALMSVSGMMLNLVHMPVPDQFALPWLVIGTLECVILGVLVSLLYKPKAGDGAIAGES
jgi:hypothetical protein